MNRRSYPLSPQQRQLWHLQRQGGGGPFRARCEVLVEGPLDEELLRAALADRVARHEVLGCAFREDAAGEPVAEASSAPARVVWSEAGGDEPEGVTASLFPQGPGRHLLALEACALRADARALECLVREAARAFAAGGAVREEVAVQYGILAEWQNRLLQTEDGALGRQFWSRQDLSSLLARLPWEEPLQPGRPYLPRSVPVAVPPGFGSVPGDPEATPAELLQACWQVLLWRLTGGKDMVVGTAFSGRVWPELEHAVGPFAKDLPIGLAIDARTAFSTAVRRLRGALQEAQEWEECFTWDGLQAAVGDEGSLFFPFGCDLHALPPPLEAGGLRFRFLSASSMNDRSRVRLRGCVSGGSMDVEILYDAGVLSEGAAQRLAEQLATLAAAAAENPGRNVGDLPLTGPAERALLARLSGTAAPLPAAVLHRAFEEQADRQPERPAVVAADGELTYGELNARANQLAWYLRSRGLGAGELVAAHLTRTLDMPVAILGILKAGAAYLPLDPLYPEERLGFMVRESGARWLVASCDLPAALVPEQAEVVSLAHDAAAITASRRENPALDMEAGGAAYVMFTSGSTGTPRGVVIAHGCVAYYAQALQSRLGLEPGDRFLHTASIAFSSSVRQLVVPLSHGAAVVVCSEEQRADPESLFREVRDRGASVADLVPTFWRGTLRAFEGFTSGAREALLANRLRLMLSASEPLLADMPEAWCSAQGGRARFVNMYGQTETTGIVATFPVATGRGDAADQGGGVVPVGWPLPGTALYLLDGLGEPVPLGLPGEICVASPAVGQGYLGRPADTAERFVPDALGGIPGGRLYRTGDLGRLHEDGAVEFLGRMDQQVKVRGFRIEPGEVEMALVRHRAVCEAAVVLHRGEAADSECLVAYLVLQGAMPEAEELRGFLGRSLPEYMLPAIFMPVQALPLTPSGKLDRKALPAPARAGWAGEAPRDPLESRLAQLWQEMLGVPAVGRHDNFFILGGHSLLAIKLISRVREELRVELPFRIVFRAPTLAGLAAKIREAGPESAQLATLGAIRRSEGPAEGLLAELDRMSDDQVSALLAQVLHPEEQA